MAILNTALTFSGTGGGVEQSDIFFEPVLSAPELTSFGFDIRDDVVSYEDMYTLQTTAKHTKKKTTCGWNPTGPIATLLDKRIYVQELAIEKEQCAKDFDGTILQYAKARGYRRNDLSQGGFLQNVLVDLIKNTALEDLVRIAFLGDTADVDPDYNQVDGIWKRIFDAVGDGSVTRITVAEGAMTPAKAFGILNDLHFGANLKLRNLPDANKVKIVTRDIYDNYLMYLASNNQLETSWALLQNGVQTVTHWGVPVVYADYVDSWIAADFADQPQSRAIYCDPRNITIATDQVSDFQTVDFNYDWKSQMNMYRVEYKLGVALGWGDFISVAY